MLIDLRETRLPGVGSDDVLERGDTLVAVGKAGQFAAFRKLLAAGPFPAGSAE